MEQEQEFTPAIPRERWASFLRRYAWDILPCEEVNDFLPTLTLHPSSEEGVEVEHRASHARLTLQRPIHNLIECHAAFAARVLAAYALRLDKNEVQPEILQMVTVQYGENVQYGVQSVLANLLADGVLQPGPKAPPEMLSCWVGYQNAITP